MQAVKTRPRVARRQVDGADPLMLAPGHRVQVVA